MNITQKQRIILDYFVEISVHQYCPPPVWKIVTEFNMALNDVYAHMMRLQSLGYLCSRSTGRWIMTEKCMQEYGVPTFEQIKKLKNSGVIAAER